MGKTEVLLYPVERTEWRIFTTLYPTQDPSKLLELLREKQMDLEADGTIRSFFFWHETLTILKSIQKMLPEHSDDTQKLVSSVGRGITTYIPNSQSRARLHLEQRQRILQRMQQLTEDLS